MRANGLVIGVFALLAASPAFGQKYKASDIIAGFKPSFAGVEYDTPTAAAELDACKLDMLPNDAGWEVKDGQGKLLRRFVDTDGKVSKRDKDPRPTKHIDQWSYYRDGFEVYREIDSDDDGVLDAVRWLNQGGTRIANVRGNRLAGWTRLSPEEATKVFVTALVTRDAALLESVLVTSEELKSLGMPAAAIAQAAEGLDARSKNAADVFKLPSGWDGQTVWSRFDGWMPHAIPTDPASDVKSEVLLYENGVIFAAPSRPTAQPPAMAYLHVPELVKVGETWKFFRLPRAVDPKDPVVANLEQGSLRSLLFGPSQPAQNPDEEVLIALAQKLSDYDAKMPAGDNARALAVWNRDRVDILNIDGIKKVSSKENKDNLTKQAIHNIAEAYRSGFYPDAKKILESFKAQGGKIGAFAAYRLILADFDLAASEPNVKIEAVQAETLKALEAWLGEFADAEEVPEVLWQLGSAYDLDNEIDRARQFYQQLATRFADSVSGKKAAGALRRLDAAGKPFVVAGPTLDGKQARSADYAGKSVVVVFWMSIAEPDRRELADLATTLSQIKDKNVEVLTVNLDLDQKAAEDYLRANNLPWPVIFEPGGLESRLGVEFGIVATPTIYLVDPQGVVVNARIRKANELQRLLEKPLAAGKSELEINR